MKKYLFFIALVSLFIGCSKKDDSVTEAPPQAADTIPPVKGWELIWHDEFSQDGMPDSTKWKFEYGPNWANGELQYYTNKRTENARVKDGNLIIEAKVEQYGGKNYTSARINSIQSWLYGRMEIRAKLPKGNGLWPAIWMLPINNTYGGWPKSGEIDIMENWSWDQYGIYGTIHTEAYNHTIGTQKGGKIKATKPWEEYHKYVLEWNANNLKIGVDDTLYFSFNNEQNSKAWPFDQPFRFILNTAVEGSTPGQEWTWQKRTMEIDYVRVYRKVLEM